MSPDEIRSALARDYLQLMAERRHSPDGWAFFLRPPEVREAMTLGGDHSRRRHRGRVT